MATEVLVPPLGTTVDTVTLVSWYCNEGEQVTKDSPLFAIETDKATLDVESPASGVLRRVTAQAGDEVQSLAVVAMIAEEGEVLEENSVSPDDETPTAVVAIGVANQGAVPGESAGTDPEHATRLFVSPRARRLAATYGVDLNRLVPSGPEGAIVERDVREYVENQETGVLTPVSQAVAVETLPADINQAVETTRLQSVRAVIAERMAVSSASTAQVTLAAEADATTLVALREKMAQDGLNASFNDLFLYILGRSLRDFPNLNASLDGDMIKVWERIHIGLAVDTDRGLLVPVIKDVSDKSLSQLAEESRYAIDRAQSGQLVPDDLRGGTFTLSNLGMYGIDMFTPIINLPECAVLGVGRIAQQPVIRDDRVVGRQMVWLSLSFDHRLVDGGPAARFLQRVVQLVEGPHLLMA